MKGFIVNNQYLEVHPPANWQPVQLMKQSYYMNTLPITAYCHCIMDLLEFQMVFKVAPLKHISVDKLWGD